jgi:hypothetical protein
MIRLRDTSPATSRIAPAGTPAGRFIIEPMNPRRAEAVA